MRQSYQLVLLHSRSTHAQESPRRALILLPSDTAPEAACQLPAILGHVPIPSVQFVFPLVLHPDDALQVGVGWVYRGMP